MGNIRIVLIKELKMRKKLTQEDLALFEQFRTYLTKLDDQHAGVYEFSHDEDRKKCRKILKNAAKVLGMHVRIAEENNSMIFYRKAGRDERK